MLIKRLKDWLYLRHHVIDHIFWQVKQSSSCSNSSLRLVKYSQNSDSNFDQPEFEDTLEGL